MGWWWTIVVLTSHLGSGEDERWARVLTGLDLQRAMALHHADAEALSDVYAGQAAAQDDLDLIDAYTRRGGRISGAVMVLDSVEVQRATGDEVTLRIVDRLGPTSVRWEDGTSTRLPRDAATERIVVLRMTDDGWRISEARRRAPE